MKKHITKPLAGEKLVQCITEALLEAIGEGIVVIDLRKVSGTADHFIVCHGDNVVHTRACADRVMDRLARLDTHPWCSEGLEEGRWILLDYSDVVVHIMLPDLRKFYAIEELWSEGITRRIDHHG